MLKIRETQLKALSEYTLRQFESRMVIHLRANFSEQTKSLSAAELQTTVHLGVGTASSYLVTTEDDVRRYLEYVAMYGVDFDTNPLCAWAYEILRTPELNGAEKMDRIDAYDLFGPRGQL
jgi:hypothetical protein